MVRFGGNEFETFSVPLAFQGRYFVLVPGDPPQTSVVLLHENQLLFEIELNEPVENPVSDVFKTPPGIVAVVDKETRKFLYKVRPGSETSVVFGTLGGDQPTVQITDAYIQAGTTRVQNNLFRGAFTGVEVTESGAVNIGGRIPEALKRFLEMG